MAPALRRRELLAGAGAFAGAATLSGAGLGVAARAGSAERTVEVELRAVERELQLRPKPARPTPLLTYGGRIEPTVLRVRQGERVRATLVNELAEHSSIHWHGVRVPHPMDGVPYVTQPPVQPGQSFLYDFTPPDTGTFFFHPHCNTVEQLGRGLAGVLVVEGDTDVPFDADLVLAYRDWHVDETGALTPLLTAKGAARAGTYGTFGTVNGLPEPVLDVPPDAHVRLRFLNLDNTRVLDLAVEGAEASVVATDGNALAPFALDEWRTGPAMRVDLALHTPERPGASIRIVNNRAATPVTLATLRTAGPPVGRKGVAAPALKMPHLPEPDLARATALSVRLATAGSSRRTARPAAAEEGRPAFADSLCLSPSTLWSLNALTWPEAGHAVSPPPLFVLERGRSYVVEIDNASKVMHPMHLHGHSFKVLDSSDGDLVPHWADTTLLAPGERRRIAFVADNPGDWMFHCHVVEHQETGMMAIVRVA